LIAKRPSAVIDTNILTSAACWPESIPGRAFRHAAVHFVLIRSDETLAELEAVVHRAKFNRYAPAQQRLVFFENFANLSEPVIITEIIVACRHPPDDKFLSLAVSGNASVILTGDNDLLALHPFRGVAILNPTDYLAR
jgi:putative PIN family toxin of toxin-antitoxin system